MATFAERLEELKRIKGITNTDLARICKINKSNITRYCNGEYKAKQEVVYRIAQSFGIEEGWLLGYDVPMESFDKKDPASVESELDEFDIQLMNYIKTLSIEQKKFLLAQLQTLTANQGETK